MESRQTASADGEDSSENAGDDVRPQTSQKRRLLLQTTAAGAAGSLAGCLGLFETDDDEPDNFVDDDAEPDAEEAFSVEFLRAEQTIEVGADETVFDAAQAAGISFTDESSCTVGQCGRCESHVDGDATDVVTIDGQGALDEQDNEAGAFLPCVSRPQADFAVDERPDKDGSPLSE